MQINQSHVIPPFPPYAFLLGTLSQTSNVNLKHEISFSYKSQGRYSSLKNFSYDFEAVNFENHCELKSGSVIKCH